MNNFVITKDGTHIAYETSGNGPSIVLVPGALALASDFAGLALELSAHFTVHVMERRGRGLSGPQGQNYNLQREIEDLTALLKATGARCIFGHSFGGFLALETSRNLPIVSKLAVFEPGVLIDGSINMSWIPRAQREVNEGRFHAAFTTFVQGLDPNSALIPHWWLAIILRIIIKKPGLEQKYPLIAGTILEHQEEQQLADTYEHYREIVAEVLCIYTGHTGEKARDTAEKLAASISNAKVFALSSLIKSYQ